MKPAESTIEYMALPQFGCFVALAEGVLVQAPMDANHSEASPIPPMEEEWGEVSHPETQEFLDVVNAALGTKYRLADYPM